MARFQGGDMGAYVLVRERVGHEDSSSEPADLSNQLIASNVREEDIELMVVDLYAVRTESNETQRKGTKPFIHQVKLHGPKGEIVRVWGLFDNGAMVDAISTETYKHIKHRLSPLERSIRRLRMANGNIVNPIGCWKGTVELGGAAIEGSFEVFDSGGGWDFLFGKTLMTAFGAVHDYSVDEVFIPKHQLTLRNQHDIASQQRGADRKPQAQYTEKTRENEKGDKAQSPVRGVPTDHINREPRVVNAPTPVTISLDTKPQEQPLTTTNPEEEKQEVLVGNEARFPPREVPTITTTEEEPHANKTTSHRPSIEEVNDEESREYKAMKAEEERTRILKDQLKERQSADNE
jgi:hypothetical protein